MNIETWIWIIAGIVGAMLAAYVVYPWLCRFSARAEEQTQLPGDGIVTSPKNEYTLGVNIAAHAGEVWPWLVQMGQGRAGFYTHEWVENLLRADISNADSIVPELQHLEIGDRMRLTPDPYLGKMPGQYMVVSEISPETSLVLQQPLPNGAIGSLAYFLNSAGDGGTRLAFRRRSGQPSVFDRVMLPGYLFMDRGMLRGIRRRAEGTSRSQTGSALPKLRPDRPLGP